MKQYYIICGYGELALKGKNRDDFEDALVQNMRNALNRRTPDSITEVTKVRGRIIIFLTKGWENKQDAIFSTLSRMPGLVWFAFALRTEKDIAAITEMCAAEAKRHAFTTFKIDARRSDKTFPLTSPEINERVGTRVAQTTDTKVDLTNPEFTCFIEITQKHAFIYTEKHAGVGGLPVGTSGHGLLMLSGGIDSPVAGTFIAKRGMTVSAVHFHALPHTSPASVNKARELARILAHYTGNTPLYLVPLAPIQNAIAQHCPEKYRIILYRRFMMRIAERLAEQEGMGAIITGESLGQVASQTIENMSVVESLSTRPVLRPLIGMDKREIIDCAYAFGSYEISIQPHEDCCSRFVPSAPATKATREALERAEQSVNVDRLVNEALADLSVETITPQAPKTPENQGRAEVL